MSEILQEHLEAIVKHDRRQLHELKRLHLLVRCHFLQYGHLYGRNGIRANNAAFTDSRNDPYRRLLVHIATRFAVGTTRSYRVIRRPFEVTLQNSNDIAAINSRIAS